MLPAAVATLLALALARAQAVRYDASATFMLQNQNTGAGISSEQQVAQILGSFIRPALLTETSRLLDNSVSAQGVANALSVSPQGINGVVAVDAHGANAQLVTRIANAAVNAEVILEDQVVRRVYAQAADAEALQLRAGRAAGLDRISTLRQQRDILRLRTLARSSSALVPVSAARPPRHATIPRPVRDAGVAAALGLLLGGLILLVRAQISASTAARSVGGTESDSQSIGRIPDRLLGRVVHPDDSREPIDDREAFRIIRTNFDFLRPGFPIRSVTISGLLPETGSAAVAASLALAFAASGRRTILVDGDLHRSGLGKRVGAVAGPGLAEVLLGSSTIDRVAHELSWNLTTDVAREPSSLWFVSAGNARLEAISNFSADRLAWLLRELQDRYDLVVLDTSPVPATAESLAWCALTDVVLLCLRDGLDRLADVARVERILGRLGGGPIGHVLTGADPAVI